MKIVCDINFAQYIHQCKEVKTELLDIIYLSYSANKVAAILVCYFESSMYINEKYHQLNIQTNMVRFINELNITRVNFTTIVQKIMAELMSYIPEIIAINDEFPV